MGTLGSQTHLRRQDGATQAAFATVGQKMDHAFETYARWIPALESHFRAKYPKSPDDTDAVYRSVIRAKALDTLRGLLPAATTSNVGPSVFVSPSSAGWIGAATTTPVSRSTACSGL